MITITLKAKHFYYITYYLKNASIEKYFNLIIKIKTALFANNDNEATFSVNVEVSEVLDIFRILTFLPEGQFNKINSEMDDLLASQIETGVINEISAGHGPDSDGNLPDEAPWQMLARAITMIKNSNSSFREGIIQSGKDFINS